MSRETLTTHAVILRAADLADADGFASVTLTAIARSFGVRTPSLYGHVRDLTAVRDGISVLALSELGERVADAIAGRSGRDALLGLADAHRDYALTHPGRWESMQRRVGDVVVRHPAAVRIVRHTDAVLHGYRIPAGDRVHATRVIGAALDGFLSLERHGSFDHSDPPPGDSWAVLVDSLDLTLSRWVGLADPDSSADSPTAHRNDHATH